MKRRIRMPKKICAGDGCNNLVSMSVSRCPKCSTQKSIDKSHHNSKYDEMVRDPLVVKFYRSTLWKTVRKYVLNRDNNLCQHCLKDNNIKSAELVHHIIELKEDMSKGLDPNNCISVCKSCHNKINHKY